MPRPKGWKPYTNADGKQIRSVTTILSRFKESGGLIHWAWELGSRGLDYREVRDEAADIGTAAHKLVEKYIRGQKLSYKGADKKTVTAFKSFQRWAGSSKLEPFSTETRLVSEQYQYGGCLDAAAVDGDLAIIDWKTSNACYPEYVLQVAAYRQLWNENNPPKRKVVTGHLIRFGKEDDDFTHHHFSASFLDLAFEAFKLELALYEQLSIVKKRMG